MTSILIDSFKKREKIAEDMKNYARDGCAFCAIIQGDLPAFKIYEDEHAIAFLDILPIRRGHTLLVPKVHHERMSTLPDEFSAHMGRILPRICRAICKATDQPDYNIVNNNGYAQVVPHVHWHCVPAPKLNVTSIQSDNSSMPIGPLIRATTYCFSDELSAGFREIQRREELDDNDAIHLAQTIANAIRAETESRL